ncbi:hypothetical protein [Paracoccus sp. S-4012]|uniref:hypothetical protein n=1 Tax=Paracoccus sp. S-4012 TaxID=2665648 RepID=UPI0018A21005|nr:hypothetical protein [Paracoccus sp. S-4012]
MANASSKKYGPGQQDQGKGDGTGGMSPADVEALPDNEILSNRDTSRHSEQRGLDSRHVKSQQHHDHVGSHAPGEGAAGDVKREKLADERPAVGEGMPRDGNLAEAGPETEEGR